MGIIPSQLHYLNHHALVRHLTDFVEAIGTSNRIYVMLDEVNYCRDWDRGVKYLADVGLLKNVVLLLTGFDSVILREARMRFPGRCGEEAEVDFHLFPLSLAESLRLRDASLYIKAEGEVDIAYVKNGRFWPIEVKWTGQIRPKDIKQIAKYPNGLICGREVRGNAIHGVPIEFLPLHLFRLGPSPVTMRW